MIYLYLDFITAFMIVFSICCIIIAIGAIIHKLLPSKEEKKFLDLINY